MRISTLRDSDLPQKPVQKSARFRVGLEIALHIAKSVAPQSPQAVTHALYRAPSDWGPPHCFVPWMLRAIHANGEGLACQQATAHTSSCLTHTYENDEVRTPIHATAKG